MKIFYSWQSDKHIANNLNRGFIEKALNNAVKAIQIDETVEVEPVLDRDTVGISGTPSIPQTILKKIDESSVFVCDVTIINSNSKFRATPNPNVLFELGYAINKLGWERVIMVMNESFGGIQKLPFDLEKRRTMLYNLTKTDKEKLQKRKKLESMFESALRLIILEQSRSIDSKNPFKVLIHTDRNYESGEIDENYNFRVEVLNDSENSIEDYRFEILFPNDVLNQNTTYSVEVSERRTEKYRFFRVLPSYRRNKILYPQDTTDVFSIGFFINNSFKNNLAIQQKVKIQIFIKDKLVSTIEDELINFIKPNDRAKTILSGHIPGGRYIVDGKVVNAWGQEIE
ncbi:MAG: nucleotide-binding protein [Pyrinomonadaceae bacterium]